MEDEVASLEERLMEYPDQKLPESIYNIRRELIFLRKTIAPMKELAGRLLKNESELIKESTRKYLLDLYDHVNQILESVESHREMATGLLDLYHTSVSNRMNEVMKVLTIISTIFIPLSFIAGIYGMNFKYMPGLEYRWGYFVILCVIAGIGLFMVALFKKKHWF